MRVAAAASKPVAGAVHRRRPAAIKVSAAATPSAPEAPTGAPEQKNLRVSMVR